MNAAALEFRCEAPAKQCELPIRGSLLAKAMVSNDGYVVAPAFEVVDQSSKVQAK